VAFIDDDGKIDVWEKQKGTLNAKIVECLDRIEELGLIVKFDTTCRICNRKLTNPVSIDSGIGPECAKRVNGGK
jgi:hypothetical protein